MQSKIEIWYCEGSPAASLAQQLAGQYALRELPKPDSQRLSKVHAEVTSQGKSKPNAGWEPDGLAALGASHAARAVCLADLERDDLEALRKLAREQPGVRLVGVVASGQDDNKRHNDGLADPDIFVCVPQDASPALVEKLIAAAFAN